MFYQKKEDSAGLFVISNMDTLKAVKIGIVTVIVTSAGIYVVKKFVDKAKYKKAKQFWDQAGQDVVVLHLPLRPKSAGIYWFNKYITLNLIRNILICNVEERGAWEATPSS